MTKEKNTMRHFRIFFLLAALAAICCWVPAAARAADVKVIANGSVGASAVSAEELKGVFLATKTSLNDGSHVEPVLLKSGPTHAAFLKGYLGKTEAAPGDVLSQPGVHRQRLHAQDAGGRCRG